MKSEIAGNPVRLHVDFKVDEEFVMPDAGSVLLTIRGTDGAVLDGYFKAPQPDPTINSVNIILPAGINLLGETSDFEMRYCRVEFDYNSTPQVIDLPYRLIPFIPMQATPASVRAKIGCRYHELPDEDVDLYASYLSLVGQTGFLAALTSSGLMSIKANEALSLREAINVIPSLQSRLFKIETKDNAGVTRNALNLEALATALSGELALVLADLLIGSGGSSSSGATIMVVSLPTDPVTGT